MRTPAAYQNPDRQPCANGVSWVPQTPPNIGGINPLLGFRTLVIDRGRFRNYIVPIEGSPDVTVSPAKIYRGDPSAPIYNATRPLDTFNNSVYGTSIKLADNTNYVATSSSKEDAQIVIYTFPQYDANNPLSCVQITYDMSFYSGDSPVTSEAISTTAGCDVYIITSSGSQVKIGSLYLTRLRINLGEKNATSFTGISDGSQFSTVRFKTANDQLNRSSYPKVKSVFIKNNYPGSSLIITIKKIMFFTADRVNFRFSEGIGTSSAQLPCNAIGYSLLISGQFVPTISYVSVIDTSSGQLNFSGGTDSSGAYTWPAFDRVVGCNTHIKVFNPDYVTNSPGFAHSLNLHLLIISSTFTPFPLATNLGYIVGPRPFYQQLIFRGTTNIVGNDNITVNTLQPKTKQQSGVYTVNATGNEANTTEPFRILPLSEILNKSDNPVYEFQSDLQDYTKQAFQNVYFDTNGAQYFDPKGGAIQSESYYGGPARGVSCLGAYDNSSSKYQSRTITYTPKIFYSSPKLEDVFAQTPLLTFKLISSYDYTGNNILQPGFLTTAVNALKLDTSGAFDIKLVYRIFALNRGQNYSTYDPNDSSISGFAYAHHLKYIPQAGSKASSLKVANYDKSWTFDNVLVSGNIESVLQTIYADLMINESNYNFKIASQPFDLYVGIYAITTLNDIVKSINFENLSSFDLPQISFVLDSDFIVYLPIYYPKSFTNGGNLQAQKDFGWTGKYTADKNKYYLTNKTFTGETYDNERAYNSIFSDVGSLSSLLTLDFQQPQDTTRIFSRITGGASLNPVVTEIDFIFINNNLSNAEVAEGFWNISLNAEAENVKKAKIKIEVDLIDTVTGKFLLKIFSTPYESFTKKVGGVSYAIKIPFTLPPTMTNLLLRVFVENYSPEFELNFSNITVTSTTINFFSYQNTVLPAAPPLGFYEDLPLTPASYVGQCFDFSLFLDIPSSGSIIYDPKVGIYINGAIYSPTWNVNLPKDMEVNYKTDLVSGTSFKIVSGAKPYDIYFRTGTKPQISSLDAKKNGMTNTVQTVVNTATTLSTLNVRQYSTESYRRCTNNNQLIFTPTSSGTFSNLTTENPALAKSVTMHITGQINKYASTSTVHYEADLPNYFVAQTSPQGSYYPDDKANDIMPYLSIANYVSIDYKDNNLYLAGATAGGNLIYANNSLYNNINGPTLHLAEGNSNDQELQQYGIPSNDTLGGNVNAYFPGIKVHNSSVLLFYTFATSTQFKTNTAIYMRDLNLNNYPPYKLFDFSDLGIDSQNIDNISVCKDDAHPDRTDFSIAFGCLGKIFVINLIYTGYLITHGAPILIYGSLGNNTTVGNNTFVNQLNSLIQSSQIKILKFNNSPVTTSFYKKDLSGPQRVAFVDYNGIYVGIQFVDANYIYEVLCDKYFSLNATFRTIGLV